MKGKQLSLFNENELNSKISSQHALLIAHKLVSEQVLFFLSAGFSKSWGYKLAPELSKDLLSKYRQLNGDIQSNTLKGYYDSDGHFHDNINLAEVAEALVLQEGKRGPCFLAGDLFGFKEKDKDKRSPWLTCEEIKELINNNPLYLGIPHLVIARLAKEGLIEELITTNYDTLLESALWAVGMEKIEDVLEDKGTTGIPWMEHFKVIGSKNQYIINLPYRSIFRLHKIHGCADALINHFSNNCKSNKCQGNLLNDKCNFIITHKDLLDWRTDQWAKSMLEDRVRNHFIVFAGFSGGDNVVHNSLRNIFKELRDSLSDNKKSEGIYRAVAIDPNPNILLKTILNDAAGGKFENINECLCLTDGSYVEKHHPSQKRKIIKDEKKYDLELVFRDIYAETSRLILKELLQNHGERVIIEQERKRGKKVINPWNIIKLIKELEEYLDNLNLSEENNLQFLTWTLPGAVSTSWLLGKPWLEVGKQASRMERYYRPYYYAPLRYNPDIVLALLRVYQLINEVVRKSKGRYILYSLQGWIKIIDVKSGKNFALLPLFLPRKNNLSLFQNFRRTIPSKLREDFLSASKIIVLELQATQQSKKDEKTGERLLYAPEASMGLVVPQVISKTIDKIWNNRAVQIINEILISKEG